MMQAVALAFATLGIVFNGQQQPLKKDGFPMYGAVVQKDCPLVKTLGCPFVHEQTPSQTMACYCAKKIEEPMQAYPCDPMQDDNVFFCWQNRALEQYPDWPESRYTILFSKKFFPPLDFPPEVKTDPRCNYAVRQEQKLQQLYQRRQTKLKKTERKTSVLPKKQNYTRAHQ